MALPIEALDKDQLAAKRESRSLNITLIKADTPEKIQQVKLIQQLNVALTSTEDALLIAVANQPEEAVRPRWREAIKLQRRGVSELTELMEKMRMKAELGTAAVDKIFHTAAGYELTEEQQKALKKFTEAKEKEEKEKAQKQEQFAAKQAEQFKWPKRGRGGYSQPYYYEGEQQYYASQPGPSHQYVASGSGYGQVYNQPQMPQPQPQMQQQGPVRYQAPQGGGYYPPPQLVRGPRPPPRAYAACFNCGMEGHFARDKKCDDATAMAYQAMLRQQVAAGVAGVDAAHGGPNAQQQLTYQDPSAPGPSGAGSG
jgi:hypothetical protein